MACKVASHPCPGCQIKTNGYVKLNYTLNILQVLLARHREQGGYYAVKVLQKQMIVKRKEVHHLTHPSPAASVPPFMNPSFHFI